MSIKSNTYERFFGRLAMQDGGTSDRTTKFYIKTDYGISEEVARQYGYTGEMKDFQFYEARTLYKKLYYEEWMERFPDEDLSFYIFDMLVQHGKEETLKILNKAFSRLSFSPLRSVKEIEVALGQVETQSFLKALSVYRLEFFIHLILKDLSKLPYTKRWVKRSCSMRSYSSRIS